MFQRLVSTLGQQQLKMAAAKGGLACPGCGAPPALAPTELAAVITCDACGHFGTASEWMTKGRAGVGRAGISPAGTRIQRETLGSTVVWDIPPSGKSGGLIGFGWVWTTFIAVFTSFWILGAVSMANDPTKDGPPWFTFLFLIPFWSVGLGMLHIGYRMKNARHKVVIGDGKVTLTREWRGKMKKKSLPLAELETIHQTVFYSKNYTPVYGIELKGRRGKLRFGSSLEEAEKAWLVADFKAVAWPSQKTETVETQIPAASPGQEPFSLLLPRGSLLGVSIIFALIGALFVGLALFAIKGDLFFRTIFGGMGGAAFLGGLGGLVSHFRNRDTEHRLEGTRTHLFLRKTRKGLTLREEVFPRESFLDIRATQNGHVNNQPRVNIELLVDGRAIVLARWVTPEEAEPFVEAVKRAMR